MKKQIFALSTAAAMLLATPPLSAGAGEPGVVSMCPPTQIEAYSLLSFKLTEKERHRQADADQRERDGLEKKPTPPFSDYMFKVVLSSSEYALPSSPDEDHTWSISRPSGEHQWKAYDQFYIAHALTQPVRILVLNPSQMTLAERAAREGSKPGKKEKPPMDDTMLLNCARKYKLNDCISLHIGPPSQVSQLQARIGSGDRTCLTVIGRPCKVLLFRPDGSLDKGLQRVQTASRRGGYVPVRQFLITHDPEQSVLVKVFIDSDENPIFGECLELGKNYEKLIYGGTKDTDDNICLHFLQQQ